MQIEDTEEVADTSNGLKRVRILVGVLQGIDIRQVVRRIIYFIIGYRILFCVCDRKVQKKTFYLCKS